MSAFPNRFCVLLLPMLLAGCTLAKLRDESREFYRATVLVGRVSAEPGWQGPVVVAAIAQTGGSAAVAHQVWLHEPGGYELIVPDGRYSLLAFGDTNRNGVPDRNEPGAMHAVPIEVSNTGLVTLLDLALVPEAASVFSDALPVTWSPPAAHSTQVGAIADLDAPAFSAAAGSDGYWAPLESFRRYGGNVYFLEPYDPARIPVLFVHGAAGSAQDWRAFFDNLDRSRYQAWFFQYPSGSAVESTAYLLYWKLLNLQLRHGFTRLHVVAHSMGGLLVRRFLLDHGGQFPQLSQFISISTPWLGETTATLGVEHSPAVVPSWRDMQPEGNFLARLFERPLPATMNYTLLFGHRGGYNLLRPTSDGTVTLASQLRPEAQAEAGLVMGFDEDHVSILTSPQVFGQVARLLDSAGQPGTRSGSLEVALAFAADTPRGGVIPVLALSALEGEAAARPPLMFPLGEDRARRIGPIPEGRYLARLFVPAFSSSPLSEQVTVESFTLAQTRFTLTPQGVLAGYVGADGDSRMYPAGSYRAPHPTVQIQRVVLEGAGTQRVLMPRRTGSPETLTAYLEGQDDAVGAQFSFVGLQEGEYVLTIVADGYEPHVSRHRVIPGQVPHTAPIVLRVSPKETASQ